MANVYCDLDLASGGNDGTSWADAYQTLAAAASGLSAGDVLYLKGTETVSGSPTVAFPATDVNNPVKILAVKTATTNEPPVQSDLIPGWRTGETRTVANRAQLDADRPIYSVPDAGADMTISGYFYIYGVEFNIADNYLIGGSYFIFEECEIEITSTGDVIGSANAPAIYRFVNSTIRTLGGQILAGRGGFWEFIGCDFTADAGGYTIFGVTSIGGTFRCIGCDFSNQDFTLVNVANAGSRFFYFQNCQISSGASIVSGTWTSLERVELHQTANITSKSSGTVTNVDIVTGNGNVTDETTAVRTGGANDGSTSWSLAFTPTVSDTQENYHGLIGPWMAFKISGDGTSQTVSVYIANSGAADYNNDDVWLEVMYPSEGGTAQYDNQTTQMDLLGTPSAVTDDTGSTWGTGANNHQVLQASIAPDYVGRAYCRVVFAKNFSSSPETLYVDPLPVVS